MLTDVVNSKTLKIRSNRNEALVNCTVRQLVPEDATSIVKTVREIFGNEFGFYTEQELITLNQQGSLFTVVAVTETGELVGHLDLRTFETSNTSLVDNGFVIEEYRNTRVIFELAVFVMNYAKQSGVKGTFEYAFTCHLVSQKIANRYGKDCGILLGSDPLLDDKSPNHERESVVLSYVQYMPRSPVKLYLPEQHSALIAKIYRELGIPFEIGEFKAMEAGVESGSNGVMEVDLDSMGNAIFNVIEFGKETLSEVKIKRDSLLKDQVFAMYVYLNLEEPDTPHYVNELEKLGFFFSGILPYGLNGKDVIILQFLNCRIDRDKVKVYSPLANEILRHILKNQRGQCRFC